MKNSVHYPDFSHQKCYHCQALIPRNHWWSKKFLVWRIRKISSNPNSVTIPGTSHDILAIYLMLYNKLPQNLVVKTTAILLHFAFCGSGIWTGHSGMTCLCSSIYMETQLGRLRWLRVTLMTRGWNYLWGSSSSMPGAQAGMAWKLGSAETVKWSTYMWPLHVIWASSLHGVLRVVVFLLWDWWLSAPRMNNR